MHDYKISAAIILLGSSVLACRPVMTVGWTEIFILFVLMAFLFGPLLFRLYRRYLRSSRNRDENNEPK